MCRKLNYLICFVLLLSLAGDVKAVNVWWSDADPADSLWSTPGNWDTGTLPTSDDLVRLNETPGPTVANESAVANAILVGPEGNTGALTIDGGTLTTVSWVPLGHSGGDGTVNMISGTFNIGNNFWPGSAGGTGTVNMTGGIITCTNFQIPNTDTSTGNVYLNGGSISTINFGMKASGKLDVTAGTLIINQNMLSTVQGFIDNGWITAYDGNGTLQLDYGVTNLGATTLTAIHNLRPNPADGGLASAGNVELSWTLPDPSVSGQPISVDVYFTDDLEARKMFTDPEAIQVVSNQNVTSVVVQAEPKTRYYWAIDSYIGSDTDPVFGHIFSFVADNIPPNVDAGADIVTWLEDGPRTGNLDATVTDEDAYIVTWTVVSEPDDPNNPDAVITDLSAEDTTITLSAVGEYVLQLDASDGEYSSSDTVTINVYEDSCLAAQSLPDYEPLVGDLNNDCRVDEADMALLEENWLMDNSLTEDWTKIE
jgi:hypothetical protein